MPLVTEPVVLKLLRFIILSHIGYPGVQGSSSIRSVGPSAFFFLYDPLSLMCGSVLSKKWLLQVTCQITRRGNGKIPSGYDSKINEKIICHTLTYKYKRHTLENVTGYYSSGKSKMMPDEIQKWKSKWRAVEMVNMFVNINIVYKRGLKYIWN